MNAVMSEGMTWIRLLAGLLLAVAIGVAWSRQHLALAAGVPRALSELWLRLAGVVIGFALIVAAPEISDTLRAFVRGELGELKVALPGLAKLIVDGLIFLGSLVLALGVAGNWLSVQISLAWGHPEALSTGWLRLIAIVITFAGLAATIPVANALIDRLAR